jgi:uncharacterized protein with PQ loop repeat
MDSDPKLLISVVASVLVCVGYAPEFVRLYRERTASAMSLPMWLIWSSSSLLSCVYSVVSGAPAFVVSNIALVFALTFCATLGNVCFVLLAWRREQRSRRQAQPA